MDEEISKVTPDNIPLSFAKQYLRVDHDLDDLEIAVALKSAQSYVRKYIKIDKEELMDMELIIPVLTLTAFYYENKSALGKSNERMDSIILSILDLNRGDIL
ncbi:hypothetical protein UT300003_31940 [Clostridium sardiniense]